jgi:hypothetical protein
VDGTPILDAPWPPDLDPATGPFRVRTQTVLRRAGLYNGPQRFDTLAEAERLGWPDGFTAAGVNAVRRFCSPP